MTEPTLLLNVDEGAALMGLGRSKVYELILGGELRSLTVGRRRLIPRGEIERFIRERTTSAVRTFESDTP